MKVRIVLIGLAALLVASINGTLLARTEPLEHTGLSASELQNLVNALPPTSGAIQAIQFLRSDGFSIDRAAILMQPRSAGWKILVLHLEKNGKFALEWESPTLRDSFAVSSSAAFQARTVGSAEQALQFSGCAAHNCPDVFSILLYSPSKNAAFTATYVRGAITYSPNAESSDSRDYKNALEEYVKQRRSK